MPSSGTPGAYQEVELEGGQLLEEVSQGSLHCHCEPCHALDHGLARHAVRAHSQVQLTALQGRGYRNSVCRVSCCMKDSKCTIAPSAVQEKQQLRMCNSQCAALWRMQPFKC